MEEKIEEAYEESRNFKSSLNKANVENDRLLNSHSEIIAENTKLKDALEKLKVEKNKHAKTFTELKENIMMLENVAENLNQKIYDLEQELKVAEEAVPASSKSLCETCENL